MCVYALLSGHIYKLHNVLLLLLCRCSGTDTNIKCAYAICMRERERKLHTVSYQRFWETNPLRPMEFSGSMHALRHRLSL